METTNYFNTFIEIAEDCPVSESEIPPVKGEKKTVANMQFDMLHENPYTYTSDDVLFKVYAVRNGLPENQQEREKFFSKGQPCFRSSPLTKRYGWGIHADADGRIAMVQQGTGRYKELLDDARVKKIKAMRSKRK